jgi:hypothetical protein
MKALKYLTYVGKLAGFISALNVIPLLLGICFWREAPETAVGADRRAGKRGLN